jgi:hypothetical protein
MPTQKASIDAAQRKLLKAQLNALKPFRAVRETMPLQYVTAFLLVATEEHLNVSEYAKRWHISVTHDTAPSGPGRC